MGYLKRSRTAYKEGWRTKTRKFAWVGDLSHTEVSLWTDGKEMPLLVGGPIEGYLLHRAPPYLVEPDFWIPPWPRPPGLGPVRYRWPCPAWENTDWSVTLGPLDTAMAETATTQIQPNVSLSKDTDQTLE